MVLSALADSGERLGWNIFKTVSRLRIGFVTSTPTGSDHEVVQIVYETQAHHESVASVATKSNNLSE